jgi:hypothetical protein
MAIDPINRDAVKAKIVRVTTRNTNQIIDDASATLQYIGESESIGDATSAAKWSIKKVETVGNITTTTYANGDPIDVYNKIWDNRAGFSYS